MVVSDKDPKPFTNQGTKLQTTPGLEQLGREKRMPDPKRLAQRIAEFAAARDWDQFHSPKNLASALVVEAAELLEIFQWLTDDQSRALPPEKLTAAEGELADVFIYLVRMADKLGVDLVAAAERKLEANEQKYPVDKARGNATKYTDFGR